MQVYWGMPVKNKKEMKKRKESIHHSLCQSSIMPKGKEASHIKIVDLYASIVIDSFWIQSTKAMLDTQLQTIKNINVSLT